VKGQGEVREGEEGKGGKERREGKEGNEGRQGAASPLRVFFKESLTRGPLRLCVNEKTVRVNDSPYFQFKGHTLPPPIPIKIIKNNNNKNRNTALSDKVSD